MKEILFGALGTHVSFLQLVLRLVSAITVGVIIGGEREKRNRPAGLRTQVLVSTAAAIIAIVEQETIYRVALLDNQVIGVSVGRLSVGVISGVGFLGAGTIMMSDNKIIGLTTAASLWCTAALGLTSGMGYIDIALFGSIVAVMVLIELQKFEKKYDVNTIEICYLDEDGAAEKIKEVFTKNNIVILKEEMTVERKNGNVNCKRILTVKKNTNISIDLIEDAIRKNTTVQFITIK